MFQTSIHKKDPKPTNGEVLNKTMSVAQAMFDDQNFVMSYPYLNQLQKNHPTDDLLKYMTGISSLFTTSTQSQGLALLLDVYHTNKKAEDIEY